MAARSKKSWGFLALGVTGLVAVFVWVQWVAPMRTAVAMGAGMLAKQMCSCMYVAGRDEQACRDDQMSVLDPIELELSEAPPTVRAFVPLLGERRAVYRDELGCMLD